jgi:hypothetical protein
LAEHFPGRIPGQEGIVFGRAGGGRKFLKSPEKLFQRTIFDLPCALGDISGGIPGREGVVFRQAGGGRKFLKSPEKIFSKIVSGCLWGGME